jgi:hypothetical protein
MGDAPLLQRLMVALQMALEDALRRALCDGPPRLALCQRGSLDPLAYWLARGWAEEFFACTATTRQEYYARYAVVIHLVTAAEGALRAYRRYPAAHRGETPEEAVHLNHLLRRVWGGHPLHPSAQPERQHHPHLTCQSMKQSLEFTFFVGVGIFYNTIVIVAYGSFPGCVR